MQRFLVLIIRICSRHNGLFNRPKPRRITKFKCKLAKFINDIESTIDCIRRHISACTS